MALLIGGPLHNNIYLGISVKYLQVPIITSSRAPKQTCRGMFQSLLYKRTNIVRNGETVYRFYSGYYDIRHKR